MVNDRYPFFTRMLCYVASWYHSELKKDTNPYFCPKVLKDLPLLAKHLSALARKVADMNITKEQRKSIMAEFPREYTNLSTLSSELERLVVWHLNGRMATRLGAILWEPGLDEMEFYDSADDLSDHLPRDSEYETSSVDNFDASEDEDYDVKRNQDAIRKPPVILPKERPYLPKPTQPSKSIPIKPQSLMKSKADHIKEVQAQRMLPPYKLPVPPPKIVNASAPAKRKEPTNKDKLKNIMNGLKRSKQF